VAYICNYDATVALGYTSSDWNHANGLDDAKCGVNIAGWTTISSHLKAFGRANAGISYC